MKHLSSLVNELKRNAAYYSAGADRDAGELLARAAEALSAPTVAMEALYTALMQAVYADLSASCGLSNVTDIVKGRAPGASGLPSSDNCCCKGARIRSSISR